MPLSALRMVLAAALSLAATAVMAAADYLTPAEIKATFGTGKAFGTVSPNGQTFTFTFSADGTASQVPKGGATVTKGTWRVNGNGYCSKWGASAEHCYTVERNGDKFDVRDATGRAVSRWTLLP